MSIKNLHGSRHGWTRCISQSAHHRNEGAAAFKDRAEPILAMFGQWTGPSVVDAADQTLVSAVSSYSGGISASRLDNQSVADRFRLSLQEVGLVGRDAEIQQLKDTLNSVHQTGDSAVVLCRGPSGVGKSKLMGMLRDPAFQQGAFYVSGKFDQLQTQQAPFSAITTAFSDLCDLLLQHNDKPKIVESMKEALGAADIAALARLIPSLSFLFEDVPWAQHQGAALETDPSCESYTKFKRLCRTFLRVVAAANHPVLLVLDDLQWADDASLDLIQGLMKESLKYTMFMCSCRLDKEADTSHLWSSSAGPDESLSVLHTFLHDCRAKSFPFMYTEITVNALDVTSINGMISTVTKRPGEDTMPLSEVILRKTHGNAYFCIQFLEMLQSEGLLHHRDGVGSWEWNVETIKQTTDATDNVADLVMSKLGRVDPWAKLVLIYAAFLGHRFPVDLLVQIVQAEQTANLRGGALDELWTGESDTPAGRKGVVTALSMASIESLVEGDSSGKWFKFSHDRVQDCLLSMISDSEELASLYLRLGQITQALLTTGQIQDADLARFQSVSFLNKARDLHHDSERLHLVNLNLEVAELAVSKGAYCPSRDYLRHAVWYLTPESWTTEYDLALRVHELSAEMEYCTGFPDESKEMVDAVLNNARSKQDTMHVYQTYVAVLSNGGSLEEALEVGFDALRNVNVKLPRPQRATTAHVVVELLKTRRALKAFTFEEILEMPEMTNPDILAAFSLMSPLGLCAFHLAEKGKNTFVLLGLRATRLTLKYGLANLSTQAFAAYGAVLTILGKIEAGCRFAGLCFRISAKLQARETEARMMATTLGFLQPWHTPLKDLHDDMMRSHKLAMQYADVTYGFINHAFYLDAGFCLGMMPFSELEEKTRYFVELAGEFKMSHMLPNVLAMHQATINLMGESETDPSRLSGIIASADDLIAFNNRTKNANSTAIVQFYQLVLAYHFENILLLDELVPLVEKGQWKHEGIFMQRFFLYYVGLSSFLLYERTGKRRHRRRGTNATRKFRSWHAKGYENIAPMAQILQMMMRPIDQQYTGDALRAAEEDHLGVNWAITHERAANSADANSDKRLHIAAAINLYEQLEMHGKADFLERRYGSVLEE